MGLQREFRYLLLVLLADLKVVVSILMIEIVINQINSSIIVNFVDNLL